MSKPESFEKEHVGMKPGIYASNDIIDPSIITFDLRMLAPSVEKKEEEEPVKEGETKAKKKVDKVKEYEHIDSKAMHSIEHLLAETIRDNMGPCCIGVFPMGCLTGMYVVTRKLSVPEAVTLIGKSIDDAIVLAREGKYTEPNEHTCANCTYHDFELAEQVLTEYFRYLINNGYFR